MENTAEDNVPGEGPVAARWHRLQAAYRVCNLATHHVLGFVLKAALLLYFVFAILFLVLRYGVLPHIDRYKGDIERMASHALGNPVTIDRIYASWSGLRPNLFLGDVVLRDAAGKQALRLPSVSATLSWWTVATGAVQFESLELIRPNLEVRRTADGRLFAAGLPIDLDKRDEGEGSEWLLTQREIVIREGRLDWTDEQRGTAPLALENMNLVLRNHWRRHQFALKAAPPKALGGMLDLRADLSHPAFTSRIADVRQWKGEIYADVRNADLAAWKAYLPVAAELRSGYGSLRAWVGVDHARLSGVTADVALKDVVAVLGKQLPELDVDALNGRVAVSEDKLPRNSPRGAAFGAYGHTASVTGLTLLTRDGVALAPTTLSERHVPARDSKPARTEVKAELLDLKMLSELATRLPMPSNVRALLDEAAPRGRIADLSAQWQGSLDKPQSYRVKARLQELGLSPLAARAATPKGAGVPALPALPAIPGFDKLSGTIEASESGGALALDAPGLVLSMPAWFSEPDMPFEAFKLRAGWQLNDPDTLQLKVDSLELAQQGMKASLSGTHVLPRSGGAGVADFTGKLDGFQINRIGRYLPVKTPEHLKHWLSGALEEGQARDVSLRLRGELAHFPFADGTPDRAKGEFRIGGRIVDGRLNYDPGVFAKDGKSPLWPQADKIRGSFLFERARMEIKADTGRTGGVALANVKAVIPDLAHHDGVLDIDGTAMGPMQEFLKYVTASPVLEWIGHFTEESSATGNAKLALKLHMPLERLRETKVLGTLALQGNDVTLWNDMPPVLLATGKIEFNEHGVNLNGLNGTLLGGPLSVVGGTQRDGSIQVRIGGTATADGLRKTYPSPAMQRVAQHVGGSARYAGLIVAQNRQYTVTVDSTLAGAALDFPAPLKKAAGENLPVHFVLNGGAANEAGLAQDDIRITVGNAVAARYQRQKQQKGPWKLVRGGIGVNVPAPEPDSGMMINASVAALNVDEWTGLGSSIAGDGEAKTASSGPDMAQYVVPDVVAARAGELVIDGRKLENVVVGATHQKGAWQASIDSKQAIGYLTWNESPTGRGLGKVTARLSTLIIPESAAGEVKELLESTAVSPSIPALDIVAERFELFNRSLGRLELQAYNALLTTSREWRVSKLAMINPDGELHGTGRWLSDKGRHDSSLSFKMDIHDAGKLLDRFGFADTLRGGKGSLSGDIAWHGLPYSLDIPSLSGKLALDVEKGQFLKQDPGAAKLLGVLSLQALPRLLKLDFHDVFSEGLAFDGISANAVIDRGIVRTENLKMHGVQATVLMDGTADIANESTNLRVVVIPQVNLGTAPLVYALAVNPVIGLGSYLAQLFLSAPVMKALTYQMQVTGPWKAPVITKLDNNRLEAAPTRSQ
ncbi:YhdP family protein [Massilia endophytica]|uniref:YhdP family protein n=1 Tax=Massilia endophytica TaxID=2899220 RepID=UPI001E29D088|nr:YhdP family protein [Massilia endophytica]UGQ47363.1 TIGR02099 family protein [Massilia endophytica]